MKGNTPELQFTQLLYIDDERQGQSEQKQTKYKHETYQGEDR